MGFRLLLSLFTSTTLVASEALVGVHGALERVRVDGNEWFTTEQLLGPLRQDLVLMRFKRSLQPLAPFLAMVERRLAAGYRAAGCAEVRVGAALGGDGCVELTIVEGPRRRWGRILIAEGCPIPHEALIAYLQSDRLSATDLPMNAALMARPLSQRSSLCDPWMEPGGWADVSVAHRSGLDEGLVRFARRHGILNPDVQVETLVRDEDTADLAVRIAPAERATVLAIRCEGVTRSSAAEVAAWLATNTGLSVGGTLTPELLVSAERALRDCGRIIDPQLHIEAGETGLIVRISGSDHPWLPTFPAPGDECQRAVLFFHRWLQEQLIRPEWDVDIVYGRPDRGTAQLTLAADRSLILRTEPPGDGDASLRLGIHPGRLTWQAPGEQLALPLHGDAASILTVSMRFALDPDAPLPDPDGGPAQSEGPFQFRLDLGALRRTAHHGTATLLTDIDCPAWFLLALHHEDGWQLHHEQDTMLLVAGDGATSLRIDPATGRLLRYETMSTDRARTVITTRIPMPADPVPADARPTDLPTLAHRTLVLALEALPSLTASAPPDAEEAAQITRILTLVERLAPLAAGLLEEVGDRFAAQNAFALPADPAYPAGVTDLAPLLLGLAVELAESLWDRRSWPVLILQEAQAVTAGAQTDPHGAAATIVHHGHCGPLGCLVLAECCRFIDPGLAAQVAAMGLRRCTVPDLWLDVEILKRPLGGLAGVLLRLEDPAPLLALLPAATRAGLEERLDELAQFDDDQRAWRIVTAELARAGLLQLLAERLQAHLPPPP